MMIPRRNEFDIFDEVFGRDPFFSKKENRLMKTDIKEKDGNYILDIDLPGYDKQNINIELNNGYLTVAAKKEEKNDESNEKGNYIYQERYYGEMSRSYYVGENVKQDSIKASFKNGTLKLIVPKEDPKKIEQKRYIQIED